MLLKSWLTKHAFSFFRLPTLKWTGAQFRSVPKRRRPTALRHSSGSQIEDLEDRSLLSAMVGVSIDVASHQLMIFDPSTGTQSAVVSIPNGSQNSDTVLSPDGSLAYVSVFGERLVYVVDIGTQSLATGINPIPVDTQAEDLVVTPDGKYLIVADGSNVNPIVVVDTATRTTVSVLNDGIGHSAVEVTAAGDVLIGSVNTSTTRRYVLDADGQLTFTGQSIANGGQNVTAAPNGVTGIEANASQITSFVISSMSPAASVIPGGNVQSFVLSPDGSKLFVRTSTSIVGYDYNQASGAIGSVVLNINGLATASGFYGTDQLDVTPDGTRLYASSGSQILAFDASSGAFLGNITLANAAFVGIDIAVPSGSGAVSGTKYNDLDGDGTRDVGEPGLSGWVIYADLNNDNVRDANEPFSMTDATGAYSLALDSGTYTLREEPQSGWIQTAPQPGLFVTGLNGTSLVKINPSTGSGVPVGNFGPNITGTYAGAFTPDGTFWTVTNAFDSVSSRLAKVNLTTGAITPVGIPNWSGAPIVALEADASGNLYAGNFNGTFFSINKSTGQLTAIGNLGFGGVKDLTFDNNGVLWAVSANRLYQVNPATGIATGGPTISGANAEVQAIMVDPLTGSFYGATYTGSSQFYTIDVATGAATPVGTGVGVSALNGGDFVPLATNRGITVFISANQTTTGRDFGNIADLGSVTGTKYNDLDGDGIRDAGEPGLPGWIIYADLDNDKSRDGNEPFTTTDADGVYTLSMPSGAYTVREEPQAGWVQTSPQPGLYATGGNGNSLISINPATGVATVVGPVGANSPTTYAGAFTPDGTFWTIANSFDSSLSRLAKVNLTTGALTTVGSTNWSGTPIIALESDAAGNLYAGNFNGVFFSVNLATGQLTPIGNLGFTGVKDFAFDNNGVLWGISGNRLYQINPISGTATPGPAVSGTSAEVQGIMFDPLTGVLYASTYTSNSSLYTINTVTGAATPVGAGLGISATTGGDFTPLSANRGQLLTINAGKTVTGRDFGNIADLGSVTGTKYNDLDGDGIRDAGEPGLPGWIIYADLDNDKSRDGNEPFTTTDADGVYTLSMPSGAYTVREEPQTGWVQTSPQPSLYATGGNGNSLISINPATGVATVVGPVGANSPTTYAGAFTPDGTFWTIANSFDSSLSRLAKVNLTTGALTTVGSTNWSGAPIIALESDAAGNLYAGNFNGVFFSVNLATGQLTPIGNLGFTGVKDFAFDNNGVLWGISGNRLYQINPVSGTATPGPAVSGTSAEVQGIMFDPLTGVLYASTYTSNSSLYTINTVTGAATPVGAGLGISATTGGDFVPLSANRGQVVAINIGKTLTGRDFGNKVANTPPTITSAASVTVPENSTVVLQVTATDSGLPAQSITYSIVGGADQNKFAIDPVSGLLSFVTAPNYEAPSHVTGSPVYYVIVKATDSGTPALSTTQAISVNVQDVNDAPVILTGASLTVPENFTLLPTVVVFDEDRPSQSITFSITGGTDADQFFIDPTSGALAFVTPPDFEAPEDFDGDNIYHVTILATDSGTPAMSTSRPFTVTVTDANESPRITSSGNLSVAENTLPVQLVLATDADLPAQSIMFAIFGGADASKFAIDPVSGALAFITAPNFEAPTDANGDNVYDVAIIASDNGAPSMANIQTISITVTDVNEAPVITSSVSVSVAENSVAALTVLATDEDVPAQAITFSISGGADASKFTIDPVTGALAFITAPNFEAPTDANGDNIYDVAIIASDNGVPAMSNIQTISITVTDVNEAPVITSSASVSVAENSVAALTVLANDEDLPAQSITFSISGGVDASKFTIDSVSGALAFITAPNFEAPTDSDGNNVYQVTIQATDNGQPALFVTQPVAVTITDVATAVVSLSKVSDATEANTAAGKFRVSQSLVSSSDTVIQYSISGTASAGTDYASLSGTVTIPAGQTSAQFDVLVLDDAIIEGTETVVVTLTDLGVHDPETELDSTASNLNATMSITDNDYSTLSISSPTVTEGNSGTTAMTFTVTSSKAVPGGFSVPFSVSNVTTSSNDYSLLTSGPLTFTGIAGETRTITINVIGDANSEISETLAVALGGATPANPALTGSIISGATGIGTIVNDDTVTLTINNVTGSESAGSLNFAVAADKAFDTNVTLTVTFTGVTATGDGVDFAGTSQQITFLAGQTAKTVSVGIVNDGIVEATETFTVSLSASAPLDGRILNVADTGTGTITDNDLATVSIAKLNDGDEATTITNGAFSVIQSAVSSTDTVVNYAISGTATAGATKDYMPLSGSVTIPAGQTSATIAVNVLNDDLVEGTETVILTLSSLGAHDADISLSASSSNRTATVNITDNDTPVFTSSSVASTPENTSTSTVVLDVNVNTALIPGYTTTFSISGPDAALLRINASTGQITFRNSPNYEAPADQNHDNVYQVTVTASVNTSPVRTASQDLAITVTPVNDFTPVFANAAPTFSIPENSAAGTVVGGVSATDGDLPPQVLTYSIIGGNSSGAFTINPISGQITVANSVPLNYEATTRFTLTVQVSDNGSPTARTANATVTVNLTNVVEAPTIALSSPSATYRFGSPYELLTPDASFTYGDAASPNFNGAKLTVSIASGRLSNDVLGIVSAGTGANQININSNNGKVYLGSTQIGTFTGGSGSNPALVVTFNSNATVAAVEKLLQRLSLKTNGAVGTTRTVSLQIKGIAGVNSNTATREITVVP